MSDCFGFHQNPLLLPTLKLPFPSCVQCVLLTVNAASTNQMLEITSTFLEAETVGLFYKKLWKFPLQTFKAVEIHACCLASASASFDPGGAVKPRNAYTALFSRASKKAL